jgi:hypothetical protein
MKVLSQGVVATSFVGGTLWGFVSVRLIGSFVFFAYRVGQREAPRNAGGGLFSLFALVTGIVLVFAIPALLEEIGRRVVGQVRTDAIRRAFVDFEPRKILVRVIAAGWISGVVVGWFTGDQTEAHSLVAGALAFLGALVMLRSSEFVRK